jgi:N-dimethylarginine dimethylaminohydrolase
MLKIENEFSPLTDLCVCLGESIPEYETYVNIHPEFTKYHTSRWNKQKLLDQQHSFFDVLQRYGISLHFIEQNPGLPWQMYTRDTGFVVNNKLFYCSNRGLPERIGEIDTAIKSLSSIIGNNVIEIARGTIEGGDVLVDDGMAYVGLSARTTQEAADNLAEYIDVVTLELGQNVMHLDTRMTILPNKKLLIFTPAFAENDLRRLREKFDLIEVTQRECYGLATNVFVIDPETIVVDSAHTRLIKKLEDTGFWVEAVDYSEPIAIAGSFRCTTLPLARQRIQ